MVVSEGFRQYVEEQLGQVTAITLRRMFGGVGIYSRGFFFALMDNDTLFFKVDESNRPEYEARGMHQFRPFGDDRQSLGYYEVPAEVLEDTELLRAWVRKSVSVAMSKAAQKRPRRRKVADQVASGKLPARTQARSARKKPAPRKITSRRGERTGRRG
jgi:DNA transformation protein